ncbi:hypothetical protein ZWY2020_032340, partial [Hordeum vulgare]
VDPLSFLLGKWRREGEGTFPTIAPFRYGQEILFSHHPSKVHHRLPAVSFREKLCLRCGHPVISYTQRTWKAASGDPMHTESGYWRPCPDDSVEVVIAQSTGLTEVQVTEIIGNIKLSPRDVRDLIRDSEQLSITSYNNSLEP